MNLSLTVERHARKEGIQQGIQQGEETMLVGLVRSKFRELPEFYLEKMHSADSQTLMKWAINCMTAQTLDDVFKQ